MHFSLTEDQIMIRDAAREFAQNEMAPVAAEFDLSGECPAATTKAAAELGFMGIEVPEEYGGSGLDTISYVLVMAEISAADASHGTIVSVNNSLYGVPFLAFGTEEQKQRYIPPASRGESVPAFALTEPGAGSDAALRRGRVRPGCAVLHGPRPGISPRRRCMGGGRCRCTLGRAHRPGRRR